MLISSAVNEAVRLESPIRGFTRVAVKGCGARWHAAAAGSRVLVPYASANRDERKWERPEKFDVRREAHDHLGFGVGAHVCAGMHLARLEIADDGLCAAMCRFDVGEPVPAVNDVLRGFARLPVIVW